MKNTIVFVSDLVNLEEALPIAYYLRDSVTIVDLNGVIKQSSYTLDLIDDISVIYVKHKTSILFKLLLFVGKIFEKIRFRIKYLSNYAYQYRLKNYSKWYFDAINSSNIKIDEISTLIVPPQNDLLIREIVHCYRKQHFPGKIIGLSQAIPVIVNLVQNKKEYKIPTASQYFSVSIAKLCDQVLYNSNITIQLHKKLIYSDSNKNFLDRFHYINSMRNTSNWQNIIENDLVKTIKLTDEKKNGKKNVLYIHSNFYSNIVQDEVQRSIRILSKYKSFNIGIRPHVRLGKVLNYSEIRYLFRGIEGYKIFHKSLLESILWSDIVVFYGSSACIDALIQKKHIIFLEFATSNKLDESLYEYVVKCQTPDDFIVEIDNLYMNGIKKCETLHFPKVESVINEWKELLDID